MTATSTEQADHDENQVDLDVARQFHTSANLEWGGFSIQERDRRWYLVRDRAAAAGLDGLLVPWGDGPDGGYLTQLDDAIVVFPAAPAEPAVISDWGARSPWTPNAVRTVDRSLVPHIVSAFEAAGLTSGRIGVGGLTGGTFTHVRTPDGVAGYRVQEMITAALPNVEFVPATDIIGQARYVKSAEEIACLAAAARIADDAAATMAMAAQPGSTRASVRAALVEALFTLGSEYRPQELASSLPGGHLQSWPANADSHLPLIEGEIVVAVVRAVWGSYTVQLDRSIFVGNVSNANARLRADHARLLDAVLDAMVPGAAIVDAMTAANDAAPEGTQASVAIVGAGLGDDAPFVMPDRRNVVSKTARSLILEPGNVLCVAPRIRTTSGDARHQSGEVVVITPTGASQISDVNTNHVGRS